MRQANIPRLTQVYTTLQQHPGSTIGDLGRLTGLGYNVIQALLLTLDSQGYYLTEDQDGRLYTLDLDQAFVNFVSLVENQSLCLVY